jgi:hypothetical protein
MTAMFDPAALMPEPAAPATLANVSRRFVLQGLAASGALVVGASVLPGRATADWLTGAGRCRAARFTIRMSLLRSTRPAR